MAEEKEKRENLVTPVGEGLYVYVNKADTKYDKPHGVYRAKLVISKDADPEVREWAEAERDRLVSMQEAALAKGKKDFKGGKGKVFKGKSADMPVIEDSEGNIVFSFKKKAAFVDSNDVVVKTQVPVFDAKGKVIDRTKVMIGNGSQIRVSYYAEPFYNEGVGAGVTLRLQAIQVVTLVAYVAGANPEKFGFAEVEGGYEYDETADAPAEEEEAVAEENETPAAEEAPEGEEVDAEAQAIIDKALKLATKKPAAAAIPAKKPTAAAKPVSKVKGDEKDF